MLRVIICQSLLARTLLGVVLLPVSRHLVHYLQAPMFVLVRPGVMVSTCVSIILYLALLSLVLVCVYLLFVVLQS